MILLECPFFLTSRKRNKIPLQLFFHVLWVSTWQNWISQNRFLPKKSIGCDISHQRNHLRWMHQYHIKHGTDLGLVILSFYFNCWWIGRLCQSLLLCCTEHNVEKEFTDFQNMLSRIPFTGSFCLFLKYGFLKSWFLHTLQSTSFGYKMKCWWAIGLLLRRVTKKTQLFWNFENQN